MKKNPDNNNENPTHTLSMTANAEAGADTDATVTLSHSRRRLIKVAIGTSLAAQSWSASQAGAAKPPEKMRPQPNDALVFRFGDNKGQPITPDLVPEGAELLEASAMDPASQVMRDKSRLNGINLVRINPDELNDETRPHCADNIVAYSSVCTHQGCDLTQWLPESSTFKCYCHYSEFEATTLGTPRHGPAKRKLAILPIALNDKNELIVVDKFQGKVGFKK